MTEVILRKPLSPAHDVLLTAEKGHLESLSDEDFLKLLPPLQQETIKKYAQAYGLSFRAAFDEMMSIEIEENFADRGR